MLQPNKSKGINKYEKKPSIADLIEETNVRRTKISDERNPPKTKQSFRKKTDKEIIAEREARIAASETVKNTSYTKDNWRQQLAAETQATGDKLRVSNEPNFFDDYINPAVMIGDMASNLGQAPLRAQQSDSVLPYIMSVGAPLTAGVLAGIGAKTTGQFVNNITNPLAGTGKLIDNLGNKYLPNAYKYNPLAFKPKTDAYYRQVFSKNEIENPLITRSMQKNNDPKGISAYINSSEEKFLDANTNKPFELLKLPTTESLPYFNKGKPYYTENYTKFKNNERLLESNKNFKDYEDFNPAATNYMSDKPEQASLALQMSGDIRVLNPFSKEGHNLENYNIYKKDWLQGYKKLQQGGYINQNNMSRYAQGGDLTQFNTGGTHESSPIGGVPIGNNNSVEQGETKQNNFIYSNRIFLDSNTVSQYNLPKSLVGKSVADATKFIDNKFKGRNDKISQSTKNGMLSKIAEAQEAMKPAEPEMEQSQEGMIDPTQMAFGGYVNRQMSGGGWYDQNNPYFMNNPGVQQSGIGPMNQIQPVSQLSQANSLSQIKPSAIGNQLSTSGAGDMSSMASMGANAAMPGMGEIIEGGKAVLGGIGNIAGSLMSKSKVDTSGIAPSAKVDSSGDVLKQGLVSAISNPSPSGMIKTLFSTGAGLITAGKAKKAALKNSNNFARRTNAQFSDQYAMGGNIKKYEDGGYYDKNNPYFMTNPGPVVPTNQETVSSNKLVPFPKPQLQGLPFIPPINKEERVAYQRSKGLSAKDATGTLGPKTKAWIASDVMNSIPETPPSVNTGDPIITPTQTLAGFEAYADAKQAEEAVAAEAIKNKKSIAGKALSYTNDNLGNIARYAPIAANALQLAQLKKPQGERLDRLGNRYKPEYVDEAVMRNIVDQEANNQINALTQSGASQGAVRNAILGAGLNKTKALSDAYMNAAAQNRATNDRAQTFNLGVDQVNLQQSNIEKENFAKDQAAYRNAKREYITGIGEGIGDIGKEQVQKKIIAKTTGYRWDGTYVKDTTGNIVTDPTTGKPMTEEKLKEIQSIKDKKALGGYLIKNKVK